MAAKMPPGYHDMLAAVAAARGAEAPWMLTASDAAKIVGCHYSEVRERYPLWWVGGGQRKKISLQNLIYQFCDKENGFKEA